MRRFVVALLTLLAFWPLGAQAALSVLTCEPEWEALAREIGGERVAASSATTGRQDPHRIEARPSLIARLRGADLLLCTGAGLEEGWLPQLLRSARNPGVQPGMPGHLMAADHLRLLEVPERLDRAEGHIHARGNPHLHLDPRNIPRVAEVLTARLAELDPGGADAYRAHLEDFMRRWADALAGWEARASRLKGNGLVVHHGEWIYLIHWLGMEQVAALEPKPGVPPSASHLATLREGLRTHPARAVVRSTLDDPRPSLWLAEQTGIPAVALPYTVGATDETGDLFALFDALIGRLLEARP